MPEGPELFLSSLFINRICCGKIFTGKVVRNPIHKCSDINWNDSAYTISAESRGKELMLHLRSCPTNSQMPPASNMKDKVLSILFTFGMSGKFEFAPADDMPKHSHLIFHTREAPKMGLAFVDYRRFGKWVEGGKWSLNRGPCVLQEHTDFVNNVAAKLDNSAFDKPICEVMLNQTFFNGIGNYLRAEILFRIKVAPFEKARSVLKLHESSQTTQQEMEDLPPNCKADIKDIISTEQKEFAGRDRKEFKIIKKETLNDSEKIDSSTNEIYDSFTQKGKELLMLCRSLPLEVINIGSTKYSLSEMYKDDAEGQGFNDWLQCYYQKGMRNMADHNNRTIWFNGPAGPLVPKEQKTRGVKISKKKAMKDKKESNDYQMKDYENEKKSSAKMMTRRKLKDLKIKKPTTPAKEKSVRESTQNELSHSGRKRKNKTSSESGSSVVNKRVKRNKASEIKNKRSLPKRVTRSSLKVK